jgi:hypothetical protein
VSSKKEHLVVDYGSDHYHLNEYLRSNIRICVLPSSPWNSQISSLLNELKSFEDIHYIFNLSEYSNAIKLAKYVGLDKENVYGQSYLSNPFKYDSGHHLLDKVLGLQKKTIFNLLSRR